MKNRLKSALVTACLTASFIASAVMAQPTAPNEADYFYTGTLDIDADSGNINANWQITVYDHDETAITFLLRDTLGDIRVTGESVVEVKTEKQTGFGSFWATSITLAKPSATSPQTDRMIQISYSGVLIPEPMDNLINAIEPGRVELNLDSFWFPIDSRFTKQLSADLNVHIGEGWQGVTTGDAIAIKDGFRLLNTDPRLDITFSLSKSFHITQAEGYTIYDHRDQHKGTDKLVVAAGQCREFLNARFGAEHPLPVSKLIITERPSSGYARENYIAFTDISDTKPAPLMRFVCHEMAHYWSVGVKFDTVDNWVNESFAEYLGVMAVREYLGQAAYDDMLAAFATQIADMNLPHIWKKGDTERGHDRIAYRKAPLALAQLENEIGQPAFLDFVRTYFSSSEKSTEGLLKALESVAGVEQAKAFEVLLGE